MKVSDEALEKAKEKSNLRQKNWDEEVRFNRCIKEEICPYCGENVLYKKIPKDLNYFIKVFMSMFFSTDIPHEYQLLCETHGVVYSDYIHSVTGVIC